jgi:multiple sugar transport system permease protein
MQKKLRTRKHRVVLNRSAGGDTAISIVLTIFGAFMFLPMLYILMNSVKPMAELWIYPPRFYVVSPTLNNFKSLFSLMGDSWVPFSRYIFNTVFISVLGTFGNLMLSSMAAYALAKLKFRYRNLMYTYFLIGLMVPGEATIVALFVWANELKLIDTYWGLILPSLAGSMNIIIMTSFLQGIPNDLIEAARIDGAGEFRTYWNVILPLARTVIVTVSIFTFIGNWNSYLWPYLCAMSEDMFTLPIGIPTFISQFSIDKTIPMTVNMIASVPILTFFVIFEKQIVKGISLAGIKG